MFSFWRFSFASLLLTVSAMLFLPAGSLHPRTWFIGSITEVDLAAGVLVFQGNHLENLNTGHVLEIVYGDTLFGKARVTYLSDDFGEAKMILGSLQQLSEQIGGKAELVDTENRQFYVLEPAAAQQAVIITTAGDIQKIEINEFFKNEIYTVNASGSDYTYQLSDIEKLFYSEEPQYHRYIQNNSISDTAMTDQEQKKAELLKAQKIAAEIQKIFRSAEDYFHAKNYSKAVQLSDRIIEKKPTHRGALLLKARSLHHMKNHRYAIAYYEKALDTDIDKKTRAEIEYAIGKAHLERGNTREARQFLNQALENGKDDLETSTLVTQIELETGNFNRALSTAQWALKHNKPGTKKQKAGLYALSASIYLKQQYDIPSTEKNIKLALALDPSNALAREVVNQLRLEKAKIAETEKVDIAKIQGAWRKNDDTIYVTFFEETVLLLFYQQKNNRTSAIIFKGYTEKNHDSNTIVMQNPLKQVVPVSQKKKLKFSQLLQLRDTVNEDSEGVKEIESDVVFKVKTFTPLKLSLVIDGATVNMVPMDTSD